MIGSKLHGISSGTLYSFFPRNKRLKISKQGLNFINHKNTLNKNSFNNKDYNNIDNDSFNINGLTFMSQSQKDFEHHPSKKNLNQQVISGVIIMVQIMQNLNIHL